MQEKCGTGLHANSSNKDPVFLIVSSIRAFNIIQEWMVCHNFIPFSKRTLNSFDMLRVSILAF